jgi:hypothetical protein
LAFGLAACDGAGDDLGRFPNGEPRLTDRGGFVVTLTAPTADEGELAVVDELRMEVAFPGYHDPLEGQRGIPGLDVEVYVHALDDAATASLDAEGDDSSLAPRVIEVGDGQYRIVDLGLGRGAWAIDLELSVGEHVDDYVEFAFEL